MVKVRKRDIQRARSIPNRFVGEQLGIWGDTRRRIDEIVHQFWVTYDSAARKTLVDELLPILEELIDPDRTPTDKHRNACETAVTEWLIRQ